VRESQPPIIHVGGAAVPFSMRRFQGVLGISAAMRPHSASRNLPKALGRYASAIFMIRISMPNEVVGKPQPA